MRPWILIVGGVDSSGGAGIDADRDAARFFEVDTGFVATAFTDQDDAEVRSVGEVEPADWLEEARISGPAAAVKIGLLPSSAAVRAAASLAQDRHGVPLVVDPVLASSSGFAFLDESGRAALVEELLPRGVILTPNLHEAATLSGVERASLLESLDARLEAALALIASGCSAVVLKGGHATTGEVVHDLCLARGERPHWFEHPRVGGARLRGTGCRFATGLAANLAAGRSLPDSVAATGGFVARRLAEAPR